MAPVYPIVPPGADPSLAFVNQALSKPRLQFGRWVQISPGWFSIQSKGVRFGAERAGWARAGEPFAGLGL